MGPKKYLDINDSSWPFWRFGLKQEDFDDVLRPQFNTYPISLQSSTAFHCDVLEICEKAADLSELKAGLERRRRERVHELERGWRSVALKMIVKGSVLGEDPDGYKWFHFICMNRHLSLKSIVAFASSFFPKAMFDTQIRRTGNVPMDVDHIRDWKPSQRATGTDFSPLDNSGFYRGPGRVLHEVTEQCGPTYRLHLGGCITVDIPRTAPNSPTEETETAFKASRTDPVSQSDRPSPDNQMKEEAVGASRSSADHESSQRKRSRQDDLFGAGLRDSKRSRTFRSHEIDISVERTHLQRGTFRQARVRTCSVGCPMALHRNPDEQAHRSSRREVSNPLQSLDLAEQSA